MHLPFKAVGVEIHQRKAVIIFTPFQWEILMMTKKMATITTTTTAITTTTTTKVIIIQVELKRYRIYHYLKMKIENKLHLHVKFACIGVLKQILHLYI